MTTPQRLLTLFVLPILYLLIMKKAPSPQPAEAGA